MQSVGNLLQGKPGGGQQQLGALNAYIFDIVCQAGVHLPLEFLCQVVFGVAKALGQLVDGNFLLGVQLNIRAAVLYLLGHLRVGAAAVYPVYKIRVHRVGKLAQLRAVLGVGYTLNVGIAQRIAFLREKASFNGSTAAQGGKYNHRYCHQSGGARYIEKEPQISRYTLETSTDGTTWQLLQEVSHEGSNAYFPLPERVRARYIRLTGGALPYGQTLRISGLRIFGFGGGAAPAQAQATVHRTGPMNALVQWQPLSEMSAQGCNIRYGIAPDKLYQSWLVYGVQELDLSTLMAGQDYYLRVDSFNENGITEGSLLYCPAENHK